MLSQAGTLATATAALSGALTIWPSVCALARARLLRLATPAAPGSPGGSSRGGRPRAVLFAGLAGAAVVTSFPSTTGGLAAAGTTWVSYLVLRGSGSTDGSSSRLRRMMAVVRSREGRFDHGPDADPRLPFVIDLLAVCLRAGMPTPAALRSVSSAAVGESGFGRFPADAVGAAPVSVVLSSVAAATELGSEPSVAWQDWIAHPRYGPLARAMIVTGESGSAVAGRLDLVSKRLRTVAGQAAVARAQRAGVALMAPLGLCFLPAFVCLGVVPVVVGIAGWVFG